MRFWRNSLFAKVYLTLLAALAIVAIASAAFIFLGDDDMERGWTGRRDAFLAAIIPAGGDPAELMGVLRGLARAFDADITVYDANKRPIASVGHPPPPDALDGMRRGGREHPPQVFATRLPDGRYVAAHFRAPFLTPPGVRRNPLTYLVLIAALTGLAAYPVVRHLTRRLEKLRRGMAAFGGGELGERVAVEGRDEVATVARAFNDTAGRIERMINANRALLANASHELRSPLARLRMAIDLLERDGAKSPATRDEIIRNLAELDMLVEEILLASRLDHVRDLERAEQVELLALIAEEASRNGASVTGEPATIRGDRVLLTRLVRNLFQNAARHGVPPVAAEVGRVGDAIELSVRDHGPGIPEAERTRVFEPFYRPAGRSESAGGWGLGLSLVQQIARHHGAQVRVESPDGGGARFVVQFPIPPGQDQAAAATPST